MLNGRLARNIQCQPTVSAISPPASGPAMEAKPYMDERMPMYFPRTRGSNSSAMAMNTPASTKPPPAPCTARHAASASRLSDSAQQAEATANTLMPQANTRLWPKRVAHAPHKSVASVQVSRYEVNGQV